LRPFIVVKKIIPRVTRLGEFSPNRRLLTLGRVFLKITKVAHIFVLWAFPLGADYALILTKTGLGYILGDFL
jgi:hypothetical protein